MENKEPAASPMFLDAHCSNPVCSLADAPDSKSGGGKVVKVGFLSQGTLRF